MTDQWTRVDTTAATWLLESGIYMMSIGIKTLMVRHSTKHPKYIWNWTVFDAGTRWGEGYEMTRDEAQNQAIKVAEKLAVWWSDDEVIR